MDRLVCGDVGYGKTEVGLGDGFKAVLDQRKVAILVPTTVLALQHFNTFKDRLKAFPVRVELLSRFRSEKEQKQLLEDLALGKVDIVIGTHRLLQKDVVFLNLGLLVIDEEQRFGVAHKELLKQLCNEVDVLTMTATPIPSTLHMSLLNERDMRDIVTSEAVFGLAQHCQLRGRDGRATHQAYAYFLYNKDTKLPPVQEKRLRAIFEATELGAGFRIAMKDLEIRGAGNLLGAEQSGFMNSVGFDLYVKLLAEAVEGIQGKRAEVGMPGVVVDLPLDAYLPDDYVGDRTLKVKFYQRLANLNRPEQIEAMEAELTDRFGPPPLPVKNLLAMVRLKVEAAMLGFEAISAKDNEFVLTVRRTIIPNRIVLYRLFHNQPRLQHGRLRIPGRLLGSNCS